MTPDVAAAPTATAGPTRFDDGPATGAVRRTQDCPTCTTDRRWFQPDPPRDRPEITSPEAAVDVLAPLLVGRDRESCVAALLDTKHRLLDVVTVSVGSIDHTFMSPREVYRDALLANAAALVVAHNHPSGAPEPSADDRAVTARLARAGEMIGIELLDHLVVSDDRWVSLARLGAV